MSEENPSPEGASRPSTLNEKTIWEISPSPLAVIPGLVISLALGVLAYPYVLGVTQAIINATAMAPWTERGVVIFYRLMVLATFLPAMWFVYKIVALRSIMYHLTNQRLLVRTGIVIRHHEDISLVKIQDTEARIPLFGMIFGYGSIRVISRDETSPVLQMKFVSKANERKEDIRANEIAWKERTGFREFDSGNVR